MRYDRNRLPSRYTTRIGSKHFSNGKKEPNFSLDLRKKCTKKQVELLDFFEKKMEDKNKISLFNFHFLKGTYRIKNPGIYVLRENILFNPEKIFPDESQKEEYPTGKNGPYHLGFFAAITIECNDVILDLNGYSITQSKRHSLLQRFFANIELASSPFIPKQGPHSFTDNIHSAKRCLVMNGKLLNSSHHGIHSNDAHDIVLHKLTIHDYEVAGIALNGSTNSIINNCSLIGKNKNIHVLSSFSQSLFTARVLESLGETSTSVYSALDDDIQKAFYEIMSGKEQTTYFKNKTGQYDGNMYGIVLNVNGIVINDFLSNRENLKGNSEILVYDTKISSVETHPVEIVALPSIKTDTIMDAYGAKRQVGVFGDVFDIEKVMNDKRQYNGNSLSDAQLFLAEKYPGKGTINITNNIIEWAKNENTLPDDTIFVPEGDSMGHFMKGNIGIFISGGTSITIDDSQIDGVITNGSDVGNSDLLTDQQRYFQGGNAYGILKTASENITINNVIIKNIFSRNPNSISKKIESIN